MVVLPPRETPMAFIGPRPSFCASGRAVCLDVAAVDLASLSGPAFVRQRRQNAGPEAPSAPSVPAVVDRRAGPLS